MSSEKFINIVAFVVFGSVPDSLFHIALAAAQDILVGTEIPTAVVYLCDIVPYFLATLVLPQFLDKISHLSSMWFTFVFCAFGIAFLAVVEASSVKLLGVCLISFGLGFADVGFLSLSALYGDVTVNAYVAGAGIGSLAAAVCYAGATTWACVSMDTTLMSMMWLPLLLPISFFLMDKKSDDKRSISKATSHEDVPYSALQSDSHEKQDERLQLTRRDKLEIVWTDMPLFLSFHVAEYGKYFLIEAAVTTLAFSNAPFEPRDHYQYYFFAVILGTTCGTSSGLIMHCLNLPSYTRHTWIFASVITASVLFLVLASWFRFLQSVWFVVCVAFIVGVNEGVVFNCTFSSAASNTSSARHKGFSRAFLTASLGTGILCASFLGLYIEPLLKKHCFLISENSTNCLTRSMHVETNRCLFN